MQAVVKAGKKRQNSYFGAQALQVAKTVFDFFAFGFFPRAFLMLLFHRQKIQAEDFHVLIIPTAVQIVNIMEIISIENPGLAGIVKINVEIAVTAFFPDVLYGNVLFMQLIIEQDIRYQIMKRKFAGKNVFSHFTPPLTPVFQQIF